jgi:hypothetical protein
VSDDLDDLLGSLASGPVPPLAESAVVRGRGEQRRRRLRAATGVAAVALVVAGSSIGLAAGDDADSGIRYVTPTPTATAEATDPPTPTVPPKERLRTALLTAADLSAVAGGTWKTSSAPNDANYSLMQACPAADRHGTAGWSQQYDGPANAIGQVQLFPGDGQAEVDAIRGDVSRCPRRAADSADGKASASYAIPAGTSGHAYLVVRQTDRDCDTCTERSSLWIVVAAGHLVSSLHTDTSELPRAAEYATRMVERMRASGA